MIHPRTTLRPHIRHLTPPLPPRLNIPPTSATATKPQLYKRSKQRTSRRSPHKRKHGDANLSRDIKLADAANYIAEDDEHDGSDDGAGAAEYSV